jgi:hypothetical protein
MRSLFSAAGVSCLGGGYTIRAMVADVHPIHHPLHTSRSVFRGWESNRRRARRRMTPQTLAQPMLYLV